MNELTGEDAFDRVLDRLTEIAATAHQHRDERDAAQNTLAVAKNEIRRLETQQVSLRAELDKRELGDPKLQELWEAAQSARDFIRDQSVAAEPNERATATLDRLKKALDESEKLVDPIPF